ncbi:MAG: signal peptidase I [Nanoarchaeota archaeon]|nr:signal peptidase I [Nanoarchaeota archaeon]MBU1135309.1 signal peptidase I [Nanoarchaeota archaeon]MBU2520035.1 signal peptidase I [Nanoarchaeota archaeon]
MNTDSLKSNLIYIVLGVILAFAINQAMAFSLITDMPIVAVESNSMVPTFSKGDILILHGVPTGQVSVGDIIVFSVEDQSTPIVHRVINVNDDGTYKTKGDANSGSLSFETSIQPSQIHGKSIMIVPYVGWVKIGITEFVLPNAFLLIVMIIVVGGIYFGKDKIYKR